MTTKAFNDGTPRAVEQMLMPDESFCIANADLARPQAMGRFATSEGYARSADIDIVAEGAAPPLTPTTG